MNGCNDGKNCASLSKGDWMYIAAAAAFCTLTLSIIASIVVIRRIRQKRRQQVALSGMTPMSSPLLPTGYQPGIMEEGGNTLHARNRPLPSPLSSSDSFHFPVLSADGHLLPPPSPSAQTLRDSSRHLEYRPLPEAPANCVINERDERQNFNRRGVTIGLYPDEALPRPMEEVRRSRGYELLPVTVAASTPKIEQAWGLYQPQSATYHRSFSAEGEALTFHEA